MPRGEGIGDHRAKDDGWFLQGQAGTGQEEVKMEQETPKKGLTSICKIVRHDGAPRVETDDRVPAQDKQLERSLEVCPKARVKDGLGEGEGAEEPAITPTPPMGKC